MGNICNFKPPQENKSSSNGRTIRKNSNLSQKTKVKDESLFVPDFIPEKLNDISDEYEISEQILGKGAFGEVRLAYHKKTKKQRAIKIIFIQNCSSKKINDILQEVQIMKSLSHPHIVKIFEYYYSSRFIYIVMEYMSKGDLYEKIIQNQYFSEKQSSELMYNILSAVNYLHKHGIVHRDLKPENILFSKDNILKLCDFGTSKFFDETEIMHQSVGTIYYIAPEVLRGEYDYKCDVWSCGVILYIFLCGLPPFYGRTDYKIKKRILKGDFEFDNKIFESVSDESKNLIRKMLTYQRKKRPSAEECLQDKWFNIAKQLEKKPDKQFLINLKNFVFRSKIQQSIYYFLIYQTIDDECIENLTNTFKQLDTNNDGVLTIEEIEEGFKKVDLGFSQNEIQHLITNLDFNQNNQIDYLEFIGATIDKKKLVSDERIQQCFDIFDIDNDGQISLSELRVNLEGNQEIEDDIWNQIVEKSGCKNKSLIDYEEFKKILIEILNIE